MIVPQLRISFFVVFSFFIPIGVTAQVKKSDGKSLADWRNETFAYAQSIIPRKIEYSGANFELTSIKLKQAVLSTLNKEPIIMAICSVETSDRERSALTFFLINPKTGHNVLNNNAVFTIKGCNYDIPAFTFRDINDDGKEELFFIESADEKCQGETYIRGNFIWINPPSMKQDLDVYLKMRSNKEINHKVERINAIALGKLLETAVANISRK